MAVSADGRWAASTHGGTQDVALIDARTKEVVATIPLGRGPGFPVFSPDGTRLYVMNSGGGDVAVIDTAGKKVVARHKVGVNPFGGSLRTTAIVEPPVTRRAAAAAPAIAAALLAAAACSRPAPPSPAVPARRCAASPPPAPRPSARWRRASAPCPSAAAIERWHRYFTREPHVGDLAAHPGDRRVHRRPVAGAGARGRHHPPLRRAVVEPAPRRTSKWWRRATTCRRCARTRIPRIRTRRSRRSAARGRRSPRRATSPRRSSTPTAATRPTTTLLRAARHRSEGQDRHRPLLESVQLPRLQGAHRRTRRRGGDDRLLGSGRGRLRQGRGVPEGPVGTGQPPAARRHRLRLHRARRSADARAGRRSTGARRIAPSTRPCRSPR